MKKHSEVRQALERILGDQSFYESARAVSEGFKKCSRAKGAAKKVLQAAREQISG